MVSLQLPSVDTTQTWGDATWGDAGFIYCPYIPLIIEKEYHLKCAAKAEEIRRSFDREYFDGELFEI